MVCKKKRNGSSVYCL